MSIICESCLIFICREKLTLSREKGLITLILEYSFLRNSVYFVDTGGPVWQDKEEGEGENEAFEKIYRPAVDAGDF